MRRRLLVIGLGLTVSVVTWAAAASLSVTSATLAAGTQTVGGCTASVNISYTLTFASADYRVASATASGITPAAACNGKTLSVTLRNSGNAAIGTGSLVAGSSGTETVTIAAQPLASDVTGVNVVFSG